MWPARNGWPQSFAFAQTSAKVDRSSVKLIVGLGNPGIEYQFTPHNMGFLAVDRMAEQCGAQVNNRHCRAVTGGGRIGDQEVVLAKPETFMNLSGLSVRELATEYEIQPESDLIVIYDELDLPFGSLRVRQRGSAGGTQRNGVGNRRAGYAGDHAHPARDWSRSPGSRWQALCAAAVQEVAS